MCTHDTMFYGGSVMPRFVMIYRVNTVHDKVLHGGGINQAWNQR